MSYRLGVERRGTFTDVLLVDGAGRIDLAGQERPHAAGESAGSGTASTWSARRPGGPRDIAHLLHGTTVATNAILEGKGARVGLVTTEGFRQVLQIARSFVPAAWPGGSSGQAGAAARSSSCAARPGRTRQRRHGPCQS